MPRGLSPLALYGLAAVREYAPEAGPWRAEDDEKESYNRVWLSGPHGKVVVSVDPMNRVPPLVRVTVIVDNQADWPNELRKRVRYVLQGTYGLREVQRGWRDGARPVFPVGPLDW